MAVVIRLQGLPVIAGSADIRHFFSGLHIPDGGVHIIGGKPGEAFIIFATDEDARRAMSRSGGVIKKSRIELFLSSKAEMQHTLEMNRKESKGPKFDSRHQGKTPDLSKPLPVVKKGIHKKKMADKGNAEGGFDGSGTKRVQMNQTGPKDHRKKDTRQFIADASEYVFLYGLPYTANEYDVETFFQGLCVVDVRFLLHPNGSKNGSAYVKFSNANDAIAAIQYDNEYMGHRYISIRKSSEREWNQAGKKIEQQHEPVPNTKYSPQSGSMYSNSQNHSRSKSPRGQRTRSRSPHNHQFYIHLKNLAYSVEKGDIKLFFGDPDLADSQIKFLFDRNGIRTREGFIMFKNEKQYQRGLGLHKSSLNGRQLLLSPIHRKEMLDLIESYERQIPVERNNSGRVSPKRSNREQSDIKRYIYVRNFPFDVRKVEVQNFFAGFPVNENDIILLYDNKSVGLGEALVTFPSENQAALAESLNRQRFLGTEVLLRRISEQQMRELVCFPDDSNEQEPRCSVYRDGYIKSLGSHSEHSFDMPDFGHGSYESPQAFGLSDFGHRSGDFRTSPEKLRSPYIMNRNRQDEPYGRFDATNQAVVDYDSGPMHRQRSGGAAIRLKNVPFTVTAEEILDFFYGYNLIPDSIEIDGSRKGSSKRTALAYMENIEEAIAAVNELNDRPIGPCKISLSLIRS